MHRKISSIVLLFMLPLLLTGCWDNIQIDNRAFLTAIGYDKYEDGTGSSTGDIDSKTDQKSNRLLRTITYPNIALIAGKGQGQPSFVQSTTCVTWADGRQQEALVDNKNYYAFHIKLVVIGEEAAKDLNLMRDILDTYQRSVFINRKLYFLIASGTAQEIIYAKNDKDMDMGLYIDELLHKKETSGRMAITTFDDITKDLLENDATLVSRIFKTPSGIKVAGANIVAGNVLKGTLNELEVRDVRILNGDLKQTDYSYKHNDFFVVINQTGLKRKMRVEEKNGTITTVYDIHAEGDILQHTFNSEEVPLNDKYLEDLSKEISEKLSARLSASYREIQDKYEVDIFKVGDYIKKFQPKLWKEIGSKWDVIFPKTKVKVNYHIKLRRIGIGG